MINRILRIIIPFAILSVVLYQFWPNVIGHYFQLDTYIAPFTPDPCTHPIPYVLGTLDPRFNISQKYLLSAISDAETIWEKPFGKNLFEYTPTDTKEGVLKINLIYDYRQEATSKLASLGIVVQNNRASYDDLKSKFTTLQINYDQAKSNFSAKLTDFNIRNQIYKSEVDSWNSKGGASQEEYNKLEQERLALNATSVELQSSQNNLNNMADELNAFVISLNRLVDSLNLSVDKYNTTSDSRGETFEEGVYSTNGTNVNEIDIYEFNNRTKLVRVLAHELGHALGLGHVKDTKAIMYEKNQSNNSVLTSDDLTALKARCAMRNDIIQ